MSGSAGPGWSPWASQVHWEESRQNAASSWKGSVKPRPLSRAQSSPDALHGLKEAGHLNRASMTHRKSRGPSRLPPLHPQPQSFHDIYRGARIRAAKGTAVERKEIIYMGQSRSGASMGASNRSAMSCDFSPKSNGGPFFDAEGTQLPPSGRPPPLPPDPPEVGKWSTDLLGGPAQDDADTPRNQEAKAMPQGIPGSAGPTTVHVKDDEKAEEEEEEGEDEVDCENCKGAGCLMCDGTGKVSKEIADFDKESIDSRSDEDSQDGIMRQITQGPDLKKVLARQRAGDESLSDREIRRMKSAFRRWRPPATDEIHVDDLRYVLMHLGYLQVTLEACQTIIAEVTSYSSLDFEEFKIFAQKYGKYEREQMRTMFDNHLKKKKKEGQGGDTLSANDLVNLFTDIGMVPFRATIDESMDAVDVDGTGDLDFDEFVCLMALYRASEGFTKAEVMDLHRVYRKFATPIKGASRASQIINPGLRDQATSRSGESGNIEIKPDDLNDALQHMFGPQSHQLAVLLCKKLEAKPRVKTPDSGADPRQRGTPDTDPGAWNKPRGLMFHEFLVWSRLLREAEIESYRERFKETDTDGGGTLDIEELSILMSALGYTPLKSVMKDLMDTVDGDGNGTLDFEEFVHLMSVFRSRDGFTADEVQEMKNVFTKCDEDETEEVNTMQLMHCHHEMGYQVTLKDVEICMVQVDSNQSGAIDFREFLRLQRIRREDELSFAREVYDMIGSEPMGIPIALAKQALAELKYEPQDAELDLFKQTVGNPEYLDFDLFVAASDQIRHDAMNRTRRQAGFSDEEVAFYKQTFDKYDLDGNGDIEKHELPPFLAALDIKLVTKNDQNRMLENLKEARTNARNAGCPGDLGEDGDGSIMFWVLVHLLRLMRNYDDMQNLDRDMTAATETGFNLQEVAEFREIFEHWAHRIIAETIASGNSVSPQGTKVGNALVHAGDDFVPLVDIKGVQRIVRSLGLQLTVEERIKLEEFCGTLDIVKRGNQVDFADFLRVMRWMVQTNFAGINKCAEQQVAADRPPSIDEYDPMGVF